MKNTLFLSGLVLTTGASLTNAQVIVSDDFSYVGPLTSNGWIAHSGGGNKIIMSDGNVATLDQSTGSGEDVSLTFPPQGLTDTTYFSFTLSVPSGNPVSVDADGLYFAHLKDAGTFFHARVTITAPAGGGDFGLGISNTNTITTGVIWSGDLSFDTNYQVVCSWDANTDTSTMWIDPSSMGDTSIVTVPGNFPMEAMEAFALRQSTDYTGFITVDNVIVGETFDDVSIPDSFTPVCFGDGSGTACPCLNNGGTGQGCANGTGAGGVLSASGTASVTADSMTLTADGVINNNGLFFQGNNTIGGGTGSTFGDGIRCCGGAVVRIQVVNPPGSTSPATAQMTETATTNGPGGTITAGTKKCYQFWYRDPATSPCGLQFNLTNAVSVIWQP